MIRYSVVIPMYNCEDSIINSLKSIISQTAYHLITEIIIIDDGSTDTSIERIEEFQSKYNCEIINIIKKDNNGAASARNLGIKLANNNFIALLDADDEWLENKIERQNDILEKYPNIKALGSNRIGEIVSHGKKIQNNLYKISTVDYCIKNWPCTPSLIFDKRLFKDNHYFDENLTHAEEGIFFLDIAAIAGLYYLSEPLVRCGDGKPSFGHSGLSSNLKKMHIGVQHMMSLAFHKKYLNFIQFIFLSFYESIKYWRRIILVKLR